MMGKRKEKKNGKAVKKDTKEKGRCKRDGKRWIIKKGENRCKKDK